MAWIHSHDYWHVIIYPILTEVHYNDVIMGTMASQITSLTIVYSTVFFFFQAQINENIKALRHWPLRGEFTGELRLFCHRIRYANLGSSNGLVFIKRQTIIWTKDGLQYIPRNMHTVFALLCFVVVIHWLIFPYPSGLLHWHCGNLTIAPVPAKQPWWIWINTSCEFIMNDCITTTKQSTTKPCAYFLGYTVDLT